MTDAAPRNCPMHDNVDRRKSAKMAIANTRPDDNAHWVKNPLLGRKILRNKQSFQAGAGADLVSFKNPEHAPVFFLDGDDHANKRRKTQRFLSPKAISDQHFEIMTRITDELLTDFKQKGSGKLEDIGFKLAIEVVGEILGLTESDEASRPARVQRVLQASIAAAGDSALARFTLNIKRAVAIGVFYWFDVRPAIKARKKSPKNDAISFFIDEGYPGFIITIECLTYGTAGMLTTREFITRPPW